jgi:hypothetical protein
MKIFKLHDPALSASSTMIDALSARPRADLEREVRPAAQWRERATTIVC